MTSRVAPQLFEARVTPAYHTVKRIAQRILEVVVLVIVFGGPEITGRDNFGDDLCVEGTGFFQRRPRRLGGVFLLLAVVENRRAVLCAGIAELRVLAGRIDVMPID